jgi:hypothetical protein
MWDRDDAAVSLGAGDAGWLEVYRDTTVGDLRAELEAAGAARAAAEAARAEAMDRIASAAHYAEAHGVSIAEIARLAGVTRTTIYQLLDR